MNEEEIKSLIHEINNKLKMICFELNKYCEDYDINLEEELEYIYLNEVNNQKTYKINVVEHIRSKYE